MHSPRLTYRWESLAERNLISGKMFDLSDAEADELDDIDPLHPEAILAADYALHRFEVSVSYSK